ncbi:hypothetical protein CMV_024958 [Castanea mollissima]|uniref:Uncharacterized protein n=1 Tax=Castanea mollissima TaxID=60419 RepID=A0A8J4QFG4_9ROSI|nr:hypothetical protein CMV_024958 [Castanea mollissima]
MERFGEPGIQPTTLVYIVIRDLNVNFVAVKVEVIVGQCCLEAHFAGFWHALQLFNQQGILEIQFESHLSNCQLSIAAFNMDSPKNK